MCYNVLNDSHGYKSMKKLYIYSRVSTEKQKLSGDGLNRQSQLMDDVSSIERIHNCKYDSSFHDSTSAFSGKHIDSGQLGQFIKRCEVGLIKEPILYVEAIDRLSRMSIKESRSLLQRMFDAGITLIIKKMGFDKLLTEDSNNDIGIDLYLSVLLHLANRESIQKSERIKETYKNNVGKNTIKCSQHLPFWIDYTEQGYIFNEHVDNLRLMFELRLNGYSVLAIARHFNDNGIKLGSKQRSSSVSATRIKNILTRPQAIGEYCKYDPQDKSKIIERIVNFYPPAIEHETFIKVKASFKNTKTRQPSSIANVFHGLTYCGSCGSKMAAYHSKQREDYYLRCVSVTQGLSTGVKCGNGAIKYKSIIEPCLKLFFDYLPIDDLLHAQVEDNSQELEILKSKLVESEQKYKKVKKMVLLVEDDEDLLNQFKTLSGEIKRIKAKLEEHEQPIQYDVQQWQTLKDYCIQTTDDKIKINALLSSFINKIELKKDGKIGASCVIVFKSGLNTSVYLPSIKHNTERYETFRSMVTASNCKLPVFNGDGREY